MLFNDKFEVRSKEDLINISYRDKEEYFELLHLEYMSYYNELNDGFVNVKEYFHWIDKKMDINIVYFTNRGGKVSSFNFFTITSNNADGIIVIHDLIDAELEIDILVNDSIIDGPKFISKVIEKGYIKNIKNDSIYSLYRVKSGSINIAQFLFDLEYQGFESNLEVGYPTINYNELKLYKKIYDYEEIINKVNDDQFKHELLECLFAYEYGKFFICAAGLGSIIEHLIYLATYKNVSDEKNEDGKPKIIISENSTASEYIAQLKREPFNANKREITLLRSIFADRNSVSHYNKGHFAKTMCDRLLEGITIIFHNYYILEKE